ncbi:MAG: FlgD immunoglobulin-like domain containing protein [Candidatus Zixiibacteriota bacterium]
MSWKFFKIAVFVIALFSIPAIATAQNNPPVITPISDTTIIETTELVWKIESTDTDTGDVINLWTSPSDLDPMFKGNAFFVDSGNGMGSFTFSTGYDNDRDYPITFYAHDGTDQDSFNVTITVLDSNPSPILDPIPDTSVVEGDSLIFDVTATDPDGDLPSISAAYLPENAIFPTSHNGRGTFEFAPDYTQAGEYDVWFYAYDPDNTDSAVVRITVIDAGNQTPSIEPIEPKTVVERTDLSFTVTTSDPDGTFPSITTSLPLPNNSSFIDNGDGTGLFSFTPDETQYGTGSADTAVTFYASDGIEIVSETAVITVIGPNEPPVIEPITDKEIPENDTLTFFVVATDPNSIGVVLSADSMPTNSDFIYDGGDTAIYRFRPDYTQAGTYNVYFMAYDGLFTDTAIVGITVTEIGNQQPEFIPLDSQAVAEGEILNFTVSASDPEGADVHLFMLDTLPNSTFDESTGEFTFIPGPTQAGIYDVEFLATDSIDGSPDYASSKLTVTITVNEGDFPPVLDEIGGHFVYEGRKLEIQITGSDAEEIIPSLSMSPKLDDSIFNGNASFVDFGNGAAIFEFSPDFNQVESGSQLITVIFYARDSYDVDSEVIVITVYDVGRDDNDPGDADTIQISGGFWDGSPEGFSVTSQIYNDSAVGAGGTGFKWSENWINCDSIVMHLPLTATDYKTTFASNDSSYLYAGFIFFNSTYLDSGRHDYFTAYFSYDDTAIDIDTIWSRSSSIIFDTAKVGNMGEFGLDWRIRTGPLKTDLMDNKIINGNSEFVYMPLVKLNSVQAAFNSVSLAIYDKADDKILGDNDTIYVDGSDRSYQLLIGIENPAKIGGIQFGIEIYSPDGVSWIYDAQSDGLGPLTNAVTLIEKSRMEDHEIVWPISSGLIVTENDIDGLDSDDFGFSASSVNSINGGLPPGFPQYQFAVNFIPGGVVGDEVKTICFDSISSAGSFGFLDYNGNQIETEFEGEICFPVAYLNPSIAGNEENLPMIYNLEQNYPNPFNPATTIGFTIGQQGHVRLDIYNIVGQLIRVLADEQYPAGYHELIWDGKNTRGHPVSSGIYLYRFDSKELKEIKKMILLK